MRRCSELLEAHGFDRRFAFPHGGHLINLHIAVGPGPRRVRVLSGSVSAFRRLLRRLRCCTEGRIAPTDAPGFGLEQQDPALAELITELTA